MKALSTRLWPYSTALVIVAIPVVWLLFGIAMAITHTYLSWPNAEFGRLVLYVAVGVSAILLVLVLLEFLSLRRAVVDITVVKVDFGRMELKSGEEAFPPSDNAGEPAPIVSSSSPIKIVAAFKQATGHEKGQEPELSN